MPSVLEVDVPTPPSSAGAAQVSQSWLPKAGSTLQPDPMYRQKRLALEDGAMFKTIDTSGDGFVSFDEMVAAARKASPPQSAAAVSSADEIDDDDFATS